MNKPMISVIVPVYNAEKYLQRCVDSILKQSFTDFELLLIDDGSHDRSGELCDEYAKKDNRVRVFHKENGGVSSARNVGLDNASGEYISFVDADDYLETNAMSDSLFIDGYDLIQIPRNAGSYLKHYTHDIICKSQREYLKFIYRNFYFECWGRFYKRRIINGLKFDEHVKIGEDLLFFLDVYHRVTSFLLSSKSGGYHYSYVPSSAMHTGDISKDQMLLANLVNSKFVNDNNILAAIVMVDFFYSRKVCNVKKIIYSYPSSFVLKLPLSFKAKIRYILGFFI